MDLSELIQSNADLQNIKINNQELTELNELYQFFVNGLAESKIAEQSSIEPITILALEKELLDDE